MTLDLQRLKALLTAAGPWPDHGMGALTGRLGAAELELQEAMAAAARYENALGVVMPKEVTQRVKKAETAFTEAKVARDELLRLVDDDREKLRRLRLRSAAA